MELNIELGLKNISDFWAAMNVVMDSYKDIKNLYRLKSVDEIFQALEENMASLSCLCLNGCVKLNFYRSDTFSFIRFL